LVSKKAKPAARKSKAAPKKKAVKAPKKAEVKAKAKALPVKPAAPVKTEIRKPVDKKAEAKKAGSIKGSIKSPQPLVSAPTRRPDGWMGPLPDKPLPRSTKLPTEVEPLTKREMENVLTVGMRGASGEGSLKGRLIVYQGFPYLEVIGRDKRELWFILQGPDQEVLPAYLDHKVSVSGLIRRTHAYGGSVDVRKYSAKKPEVEVAPAAPEPEVAKLRLLSPGEVEMLSGPGMGVGMRGFARLRGTLEMSGDEFYLVVSNPGTRQQVSFTLGGKGAKGLKKSVGELMVATGVVEKQSAWGGHIEAENCELRAQEFPPVSRDAIQVVTVDVASATGNKGVDVQLNHGLSVRLAEKHGSVWAIEPQTAKRVSLREVTVQHHNGPSVREFFFTPRNPGMHEVEFFLGKALSPLNVSRTFKLMVNVKSPEVV
jgi:hypothetical protein